MNRLSHSRSDHHDGGKGRKGGKGERASFSTVTTHHKADCIDFEEHQTLQKEMVHDEDGPIDDLEWLEESKPPSVLQKEALPLVQPSITENLFSSIVVIPLDEENVRSVALSPLTNWEELIERTNSCKLLQDDHSSKTPKEAKSREPREYKPRKAAANTVIKAKAATPSSSPTTPKRKPRANTAPDPPTFLSRDSSAFQPNRQRSSSAWDSSSDYSMMVTSRSPVGLYLYGDDKRLSPLECLIRKQLEFFERPAPITDQENQRQVQVGIRCRWCPQVSSSLEDGKEWPKNLQDISTCALRLSQQHLQKTCCRVSKHLRQELIRLSSPYGQKPPSFDTVYWVEAAKECGVRWSRSGSCLTWTNDHRNGARRSILKQYYNYRVGMCSTIRSKVSSG